MSKKKITLAVLPGDGIGPEVIREAMKVVDAIEKQFDLDITKNYALTGAAAIDEVGEPYPDSTHQVCMNADAVLFGAIGDPKYDNNPKAKVRPEQGLLKMRQSLGLYANIRPVELFKGLEYRSPLKQELIEGVDFICIRELTGGLYFGRPQGRSENGDTAYDTCVYSKEEVERILLVAYKYAMSRRKKLCVVDKANVLSTSRLWREVAQEVAPRFPEVETEYLFVDNAAMQLIQNPRRFDVMVTENMFGDILTDEASVLSGSMGLLPSASIGLHTSLFEPIHGSYPQAAGKNIANPLATILSAAMMFESALGLPEAGAKIRQAVARTIQAGVVTEDLIVAGQKAYSTSEVGDYVVSQL